MLNISSEPAAAVYAADKYAGRTPLRLPVRYVRVVQRQERQVSHWQTNPGTSAAITVLSLGLYLPFSALPVDKEERLEEQELFEKNELVIELHASGYEPWTRSLLLHGEQKLNIHATLKEQEKNLQQTEADNASNYELPPYRRAPVIRVFGGGLRNGDAF